MICLGGFERNVLEMLWRGRGDLAEWRCRAVGISITTEDDSRVFEDGISIDNVESLSGDEVFHRGRPLC